MEKAKDIFGNEIKGVAIKEGFNPEILQNAFDYLSTNSRYDRTSFHVFYKDRKQPVSLTTKKQAVEQAKNYDKGEAVVAIQRKDCGTPRNTVAFFGRWAIVSN
jgi:hypothetical protein